MPVVASDYLNQAETTAADWRSFFESLPDTPKGPFKLNLRAEKMNGARLKNRLGQDYNPPFTRSSYLVKPWRGITVDNSTYQLLDAQLPTEIAEPLKNHNIGEKLIQDFSNWVLETPSMLREYPALIVAYIPYFQSDVIEDKVPHPASWAQNLTEQEWVFTTRGEGPFRPCDVLAIEDPARPDAPVAALPTPLIALLEGADISFGVALPDAPAIERLRVQGPQSVAGVLLELIEQAIEEAGEDEDKITLLYEVLANRPLFPLPLGVAPVDGITRVTCKRLVQSLRGRSALADWIVPLDRYQPDSLERKMLELVDNFWALPETTTSEQVIDFLSWVWEVEPDAERVRGVMPRAYQYLREELKDDLSAIERWENISQKAKVFTTSHRRWVKIVGKRWSFFWMI